MKNKALLFGAMILLTSMVINPKEYPEDVISMNCANVGKTVFLAREDAEKALEGKT